MNGIHCFQIDNLGLCCSVFLSVNGTHCFQIDNLGLFCSEFLSVNRTHCSQIDNLGLFVPSSYLQMEGVVPKLMIWECFVPSS